MHLPYKGLNSAREFGKKTGEKDLAEKMKKEFSLVKTPCGYSITSINEPTVQIATQILARKVMRKCCAGKVLAPMVSLVVQCTKGV